MRDFADGPVLSFRISSHWNVESTFLFMMFDTWHFRPDSNRDTRPARIRIQHAYLFFGSFIDPDPWRCLIPTQQCLQNFCGHCSFRFYFIFYFLFFFPFRDNPAKIDLWNRRTLWIVNTRENSREPLPPPPPPVGFHNGIFSSTVNQ